LNLKAPFFAKKKCRITANNDLVLYLFKIRIYLQCFMTIIPDLSTENNLVNCSDQLIFLGPYFKIKPEVLKIYYHFTNFKLIKIIENTRKKKSWMGLSE